MSKRFCVACLAVALVYLVLSSASAETPVTSYVEDFTTKQYCDSLNTTAWWDTVAGEVKLHPFQISLAGSCDTPGAAWGVAISGDCAYVADGGSGLQVIAISDPTGPSLAGSYDTPGNAYGVAISGDYAYVADGGTGLQVIRFSQRRSDTLAWVASSRLLDNSDETIVAVRLSSTQTDSIHWWLSAKVPLGWREFLPGGDYQRIIQVNRGSDLAWRSFHVYRPSHPEVNPTCTRLEIEWLYECAVVDSIVDVPDDQGGLASILPDPVLILLRNRIIPLRSTASVDA